MSEAPTNGALLEVRDVTVHHGQLRALDHVSLRVSPGEVYAIIGANGAGKSTLLRTIAGLHHPTEGSILFDGQDLTRVRPERRATRGIAMVPEGRRLFESLTVEENLQVGATYARKGSWTIERVYELFGWMAERRTQRTAQLSGGEQQAVASSRSASRRWSSSASTPCCRRSWPPVSPCSSSNRMSARRCGWPRTSSACWRGVPL
jgi:branched-chain amino acid transport system ATP-binding protein